MNYYIKDENEKIVLFNTNKQILQNDFIVHPEYANLEIKQTSREIILLDNEFVFADEHQEEIEQKERERLNNLSMTRGDVFEALILAKGLTKPQIRAMIEQAELDDITKALYLNRFDEALDFYRGFPLFDMLGQALGVTPKQLDMFFTDKNYKHLLPVEQQGNEEENIVVNNG